MAQTVSAASDARAPDVGAHAHGGEPLRLTTAIAAGDPAAFAAFYEAWFDRALAMARHLLRRDEAFCLDVVQDCMLRVVRAMRPLPTEDAVAAWMAKTLFTTAVDRLRQEARRTRRELRAAGHRAGVDAAADVAAELAHLEQSAWLRVRIEALPEQDRRLIAERFEAGKTLDAVGAALGMTGDAAHGRIRRILERLRAAAKELFHD